MATSPRIEKLNKIRELKNADAFLISSASSVKYLSGYFYNFETGPSPFQLLPAALFVDPEQNACLLVADNETPHVTDPSVVVKAYASYVYERPLAFADQFLTGLHAIIKQYGTDRARIGIEKNVLPLVIAESLVSAYPQITWVDITAEITALRAIKDSDEILFIRQAAALCDTGQEAVLKYARPGITELELFALVRKEIEHAAGTRVPLMADLVSGPRTASGGGIPNNKTINPGDLVLSDLTPCLNGYWGDSCNTIIVGDASAEQKNTFTLVKEALDIGINAIRPGVQAMEIDRLMREHIGSYPHHSGHGVGIMYHEEPRIVPYNNNLLEPGMVIALEPAIYTGDYGIRLEHLVAVTETGCEILTEFQHRLGQS
jgi:Xaa-Pro aminopeptidase